MKSVIFVTLLLLSSICPNEAWLEDFSDLLSNSLSYLKRGLEVAKQVDDFVEHTIGEECEFECDKKGFVAKPRKSYRPSANGCGSFDFLFDDTEESLIHVEKEFSNCCDVHDYCYDTCGADKDECDLKFKKCLYGTCKRKKQDQFLDSKKCKLKAKLFYITVLGVGCQSYISAQTEACECVRRERSSSTEL